MKNWYRLRFIVACCFALMLSISHSRNVITCAQSENNHPLARNTCPIAYDVESDCIILYGGWKNDLEETPYDDTWTFDFNTRTWTEMMPATAPPARGGHSIAYDEESDRIILFSGAKAGYAGTLENWEDTWEYNLNTNTWNNLSPPVMPSPRLGAPMVYDSESDVIILFGGIIDGGSFNGETWAYNYNDNNWTNMNPITSPSDRLGAMTYDSQSDKVILFGGGGGGWPITTYTDTWSYDYNTNTWTTLNPAEHPASLGQLAYDEESDLVIFFGGALDWFEEELVVETWAYNHDSNTWTEMNPALSPPARARGYMAYDSESDSVILYSGGQVDTITSYNIVDDCWSYDYNTDSWELMEYLATTTSTDITPSEFSIPPEWIMISGGGIIIVILAVFILRKRK